MTGVVRVRFGEGQFLGADDLAGEQAYREDAVRRHLIGGHTWGVVAGLALVTRTGGFTVDAGLAVDGYGRVLCVEAPVDVAVDPNDPGTRDVWLSTRTGGVTVVCLGPVRTVDPRRPPGVPPGDVTALPHRAVGPAPGAWPVYLGRVTWTASTVQVDEAGRVLAGLTGESVAAASGRARMQVGAESTGAPRFAVATEQAGAEQPGAEPGVEPAAAGQAGLRTRLRIDAAGDLTVEGATTVHDDLVLLPPAAPPPRGTHTGLRFDSVPAPAAAAPWTLYRTRVERDGRPVDQLRIEIGHPGEGGDPTLHRFVVGARRVDTSTVFAPCLSVDAAGTVIVHGDLEVTGAVFEGPVPADPDDPRFADASAGTFVRGAAGTATRVDGFFAAALEVSVLIPPNQVAGTQLNCALTVTGAGTAPVTDGQVHVVMALGATVVYQQQVAGGLRIPPGTDVPVPLVPAFLLPNSAGVAQLTVSVVALGVGPSVNVVSARGEATATILPPPPVPIP
jgi:hypothetical protein